MADEVTPEQLAESQQRAAELQARVDELQQSLDAERAARDAEATTTPPAGQPEPRDDLAPGFVELAGGDPCPLCQVGVLYTIAETENSVTLRCFNCNRQASHDPARGHKVVVTGRDETPTGFTLSAAQHAAMGADDPEEAAARALVTEVGSGVAPTRQGG